MRQILKLLALLVDVYEEEGGKDKRDEAVKVYCHYYHQYLTHVNI